MPSFEEHARKADIRGLMLTMVITAFAFTAAFFWNDAIKSAIDTFIQPGDKIGAKFMAAIAVTIIVAVVAYVLFKTHEITQKFSKDIEDVMRKQAKIIEEQRQQLRKLASFDKKKVR